MILYIVYNETTKLTKIGITENLNRRITQLVSACGCHLHMVGWAELPHAQEVERLLHCTFRSLQAYGEWFKLNILEYRFLAEFWSTYFNSHYYSTFHGEYIEEELAQLKEQWCFSWEGTTELNYECLFQNKDDYT